MRPTAVLLDRASLHPDDLDFSRLQQLPVAWQLHETTTAADTSERIVGAVAVLSNKVVIGAAEMAAAPSLRYIGVLATGMNNIDLEAAGARGITVRNVENYGSSAVAQHSLMLMLLLSSRYPQYQQDIAAGAWQRSKQFCLMDHPIEELSGKTLVLVGHGAIGQAVAKLALAFDMRVLVAARPSNEAQDPRPALEKLLPNADFLSLHCPLNQHTERMINAAVLAAMPKRAFLINTARGALVDENALLAAIRNKQIAGAAMDGLSAEPPRDGNPLLNAQLGNLIITPHNAWASRTARQRLLDSSVAHLADFLKQL